MSARWKTTDSFLADADSKYDDPHDVSDSDDDERCWGTLLWPTLPWPTLESPPRFPENENAAF
jgi:hypothetical protein